MEEQLETVDDNFIEYNSLLYSPYTSDVIDEFIDSLKDIRVNDYSGIKHVLIY